MTETFIRKVICDNCGANCVETSRNGFALELSAVDVTDAPRSMSGRNPLNGETLHFCNRRCLAKWAQSQTVDNGKGNIQES